MKNIVLLGFTAFKSKKGNNCYLVNLAVPYTEQQLQNGSCGSEAVQVFVDKEVYDSLSLKNVGKEVIVNKNFNNRVLSIEVIQ